MPPDKINHTDPAELLAVVDADDNEIGAERRDVIHRDLLLHRAIHLFVFRSDGRLLLQQRSAKKDMYPLHWECVGGHLGPGEKYRDCAIREAREELGLILSEVQEIKKLTACPQTDFEFITVYQTVIAQSIDTRQLTSNEHLSEPIITPDPSEVVDSAWQTPAQWQREIITRARLFSPTLIHTLECCPELLA